MMDIKRFVGTTAGTVPPVSNSDCRSNGFCPTAATNQGCPALPEWMTFPAMLMPYLDNALPLPFPSFVIVFPLDSNGLTAVARFDTKATKRPHNCSSIDLQFFANLTIGFALKNIAALNGTIKRFAYAVADNIAIGSTTASEGTIAGLCASWAPSLFTAVFTRYIKPLRHNKIPPVRDSCISAAGAGPLQVTGFSDWLIRPFLSHSHYITEWPRMQIPVMD